MSESGRIYFGSIELAEKERLENDLAGVPETPTPMEGVVRTTAPVEVLAVSEKNEEEQRRHESLIKGIEMQKTLREIPVPTQDGLVKQRLRELFEPIVLFGEDKPDRRERLRRLCVERSVSPMPQTKTAPSSTSQAVQTEAVVTAGPKELQKFRVEIVKESLRRTKQRLNETAKRMDDMDAHWDTHLKGVTRMYNRLAKFAESSSQVGDTRPLSHVAYSPDGSHVATSSWTGAVKVWTADTCELKQTIKAHSERAQCVAWFPQVSTSELALATCGADNDVKLWSLNKPQPLRLLKGHTDRVNKVAFHPYLPLLASSSYDKTWTLWDIETGKELFAQGGHSRAVYALGFHPDGALVGTGGVDAFGRVWDLRSGQSVWVMRGHAKPILSLDFAPNGHQLATSSDDGRVGLWDLRKRLRFHEIKCHLSLVSSVQYQPRYGHYLVTACYDKTVRVHSMKTLTVTRVLGGHESRVTCAAISPQTEPDVDGSIMEPYRAPLRIASCSFDKTWKTWEYDAFSALDKPEDGEGDEDDTDKEPTSVQIKTEGDGDAMDIA